ncbi:DUF2249 domain-containing protein [Arenimonas alkanexedens]
MDEHAANLLDLRGLPAPEPLIEALAAGAVLRLLTPMRPLPLLEILKARRLGYSVSDHEDGGCAVLVWSEDGPACA